MSRRGGKAKRARLAREAAAARREQAHGVRHDITLARESKHAERVGARAALGGGFTDAAMRGISEAAQAKANGYLTPRTTREERAAWRGLAQGFDAMGDDNNNNTTEGR